jgi:hypothetical protein
MSFTDVLRHAARLPAMKRIMALAGVALALAGGLALAGCAPRADRASHGSTQPGPAVQNQPAPPAQTGPDTSSVDSDLSGIDAQLGGIDSDLSAAAKAPDDAD